MLDNIIGLVQEQVTKTINESDAVSADKKNAAIETATSSIINSLKDEIGPDSISSVISLAGTGLSATNNPLIGSIQKSVASALSSKVGLDSGVADNIVSTIIPALLSVFAKKSNDPNDSFSLESMVKALGESDNAGGLLGKIGKIFGR